MYLMKKYNLLNLCAPNFQQTQETINKYARLASDKQVLDLATETLYSQLVEMVLYFHLPVF